MDDEAPRMAKGAMTKLWAVRCVCTCSVLLPSGPRRGVDLEKEVAPTQPGTLLA